MFPRMSDIEDESEHQEAADVHVALLKAREETEEQAFEFVIPFIYNPWSYSQGSSRVLNEETPDTNSTHGLVGVSRGLVCPLHQSRSLRSPATQTGDQFTPLGYVICLVMQPRERHPVRTSAATRGILVCYPAELPDGS